MSKIRVAVIGYGHLGKWHSQKAESFPEIAELKYIVEKFPANQELAKKNHPNVTIVDDIAKCINDIDAGVVVTPTSFHYEIVDYLVKNNKHVFCEKPITENTEQALMLKEVLKSHPVVLQVGHSERFHNAWEMKESYKDFFQGPCHITLKRVAPFKGRATDVDVVQDLMIHDLDLLVFLFKETPIAVDAVGYKMRTKKYDYMSANFKFYSGHRATITVGRNQTKEVRELEISNTTGTLHVDLMRNEITEARGSFEGPEYTRTIPYEKRDHLMLEHEHFYNSIKNKKAPVISLEDGITAVRLIDKVLESADKHREVTL